MLSQESGNRLGEKNNRRHSANGPNTSEPNSGSVNTEILAVSDRDFLAYLDNFQTETEILLGRWDRKLGGIIV